MPDHSDPLWIKAVRDLTQEEIDQVDILDSFSAYQAWAELLHTYSQIDAMGAVLAVDRKIQEMRRQQVTS